MVRKIRRKKSTFRAECDGLAYEDEDGEEFFPRVGQFVVFKRKMSGNDFAAMDTFAELSDRLESAKTDKAKAKAGRAMLRAVPQMVNFVGKKVVAWNWTDLDAEPDENGDYPALPPPSLDVIGDMDFETDVTHLVELSMESTETLKN